MRAVAEWKQSGRTLFISSISFAETLAVPSLNSEEIERVKDFLFQTFVAAPFDVVLAEHAAFFRRTYRLEIPDAAIAATAFALNTPLVTHDQQFRKIREITVVEI